MAPIVFLGAITGEVGVYFGEPETHEKKETVIRKCGGDTDKHRGSALARKCLIRGNL